MLNEMSLIHQKELKRVEEWEKLAQRAEDKAKEIKELLGVNDTLTEEEAIVMKRLYTEAQDIRKEMKVYNKKQKKLKELKGYLKKTKK